MTHPFANRDNRSDRVRCEKCGIWRDKKQPHTCQPSDIAKRVSNKMERQRRIQAVLQDEPHEEEEEVNMAEGEGSADEGDIAEMAISPEADFQ